MVGFPERLIPKPEHAAELNRRTVTNLYNARPAWLDNAHQAPAAAVATALRVGPRYPQMPDGELLGRFLALNRERSGAEQR